MNLCKLFQVIVLMLLYVCNQHTVYSTTETTEDKTGLSPSWGVDSEAKSWSLEERIPMITELNFTSDQEGRGRKKMKKIKKRLEKFLLPLLLAYKLKFFTLIPVLIGGLLLLTGATGLAGFFFALFAAVMGLKHHGH